MFCALALAFVGLSFAGKLDVVYADAVVNEVNGYGTKYATPKYVMGGQLVPVYISSVKGAAIYPQEAVGLQYTLSYPKPMNVYYKAGDSGEFAKLKEGESRTIGASGIDTVYAMVDIYDMSGPLASFNIGVADSKNILEINFFMPQITFIEMIPEDGESAKSVRGQTPKADGTYEEYRTGSVVDLYLAIVKPTKDGVYEVCVEECNGTSVILNSMTSAKIDFLSDLAEFNNGYATISVRALKDYRWNSDPSLDNPATVVVGIGNDVTASYSPLFFSEEGIEGIKKTPVASRLGARKYVVMDLQGRVVQQGLTAEAEPVIRNIAPGSYIVKVGANAHRMNIR